MRSPACLALQLFMGPKRSLSGPRLFERQYTKTADFLLCECRWARTGCCPSPAVVASPPGKCACVSARRDRPVSLLCSTRSATCEGAVGACTLCSADVLRTPAWDCLKGLEGSTP